MPYDCNQRQTPPKSNAIPCLVRFQRNKYSTNASLDLFFQILHQHFGFLRNLIPPMCHRFSGLLMCHLSSWSLVALQLQLLQELASLQLFVTLPTRLRRESWVGFTTNVSEKCQKIWNRSPEVKSWLLMLARSLRKDWVKMVWSHLYLGGPNSMDSFFTLSLLHTARIWKHKHFRFKSMACSARDIHHWKELLPTVSKSSFT